MQTMSMGGRSSTAKICEGNINSKIIYETHVQIKEIVEAYKEVNARVSKITGEVNENWVGRGQTEFESQYNLLIRKIEDFGDTLQEIYDNLVESEALYEDADDSLRQKFAMAISN